ncbi:hypothetical protein, partial [Salmonella enterica]|uniref:hypothetical protein n=1 Tax=Salmonella enterica TaxID=28901 RepID=UPI00398C592B
YTLKGDIMRQQLNAVTSPAGSSYTHELLYVCINRLRPLPLTNSLLTELHVTQDELALPDKPSSLSCAKACSPPQTTITIIPRGFDMIPLANALYFS